MAKLEETLSQEQAIFVLTTTLLADQLRDFDCFHAIKQSYGYALATSMPYAQSN